MTDIEWTGKAIDLLEGLELEHQQRIISKVEEASRLALTRQFIMPAIEVI